MEIKGLIFMLYNFKNIRLSNKKHNYKFLFKIQVQSLNKCLEKEILTFLILIKKKILFKVFRFLQKP